jgi:hypothetical protein
MNEKTNKISKTKMKRLSKGLRTHIRRLKQEARKEGTIYRAPVVRRVPEKTPEE